MTQGVTPLSTEEQMEVWLGWGIISMIAGFFFVAVDEFDLAVCCCFPVAFCFGILWFGSWVEMAPKRAARRARARDARKRRIEAERKKAEAAKKKVERQKAKARERRKQFAEWTNEKYPGLANEFESWDAYNPEYKAKWDEWRLEINEKLAAEKKARKEADEEEARKLAAWLVAEGERKKAEAAKKKAEAAKKKAEAAKKKKQIKRNKDSLELALVTMNTKGLSKKIDNVSRHSMRALLSVTTKFDDIRKTGGRNKVKESILFTVEHWVTTLSKIEELNDELKNNPNLEDLIRIEEGLSSLLIGYNVNHPRLKKKETNLRKRIAGRKLKLDRASKEVAFSRPMLQTRDVPNATLNRKEKAWKLNDGSCIRCNKRSSGMAFYWDIFPDLQLVLICDECAAKEEFVHADAIEEESGEELADLFMRSVGTSEKKSKRK